MSFQVLFLVLHNFYARIHRELASAVQLVENEENSERVRVLAIRIGRMVGPEALFLERHDAIHLIGFG